jgi:hypothetical protein
VPIYFFACSNEKARGISPALTPAAAARQQGAAAAAAQLRETGAQSPARPPPLTRYRARCCATGRPAHRSHPAASLRRCHQPSLASKRRPNPPVHPRRGKTDTNAPYTRTQTKITKLRTRWRICDPARPNHGAPGAHDVHPLPYLRFWAPTHAHTLVPRNSTHTRTRGTHHDKNWRRRHVRDELREIRAFPVLSVQLPCRLTPACPGAPPAWGCLVRLHRSGGGGSGGGKGCTHVGTTSFTPTSRKPRRSNAPITTAACEHVRKTNSWTGRHTRHTDTHTLSHTQMPQPSALA